MSLGACGDCGVVYRELWRNAYFVFYQCACRRNKGAVWDIKMLLHEGVEYLLETAGSLILACPRCGEQHFRDASNFFFNPHWHRCYTCTDKEGKHTVQMEAVRVDELETRWHPLWTQRKGRVNGHARHEGQEGLEVFGHIE